MEEVRRLKGKKRYKMLVDRAKERGGEIEMD